METKTKESTFTSVEKPTKKDSSKNELLLEREIIDNTPFTLVKQEGKIFGVMGNHRITEFFKSKKECKTALKKITWNRIVQVIAIMGEQQALINNIKKDA